MRHTTKNTIVCGAIAFILLMMSSAAAIHQPYAESVINIQNKARITHNGGKVVYAILIGGSDSFHWKPVRNFYNILIDNNYTVDSNVFVFLANDGTPGSSPEIVDGRATRDNLEDALTFIASHMDGDDLFIFFIEWLGNGYLGYVPDDNDNIALHGYFGNKPEISESGDEFDYKENELELSVFCATGGLKYGRDFHYGIDEWGVTYYPGTTKTKLKRYKVLSHFTDIYVEDIGNVSDNDTHIERFTDYTLGDFNKDGYIDTTQGEILDWDGDGNPPYNRTTGEFDEDDWGNLDGYEDDCQKWHSSLCGISFKIFDADLDNHADIDIKPNGTLEVDGTDSDNNGCIDGFDLNDDGDLDDWVTIDETMSIYGGRLIDDEVRDYMSWIENGTKVFITNTCYGGGFVDDLSADNTIVMSGSREVCRASASFFTGLLCEAFGKYSYEADTNGDGNVSFMEAFNHASIHPHVGCGLGMDRFQYDDNGDGVSHEDPLPNGSDGELGRLTFLWGRLLPPSAPDINGPASGETGTEYNYTFVSTDPDGDDIANYTIDWDDDSDVEVIEGPFGSGEEIMVSHTWDEQDTYTIRCKAKDTYGAESDWGYLEVEMPLDEGESESLTCECTAMRQPIGGFKTYQPIQFYGSATGGVEPYEFKWNFGDDGTSDEEDPIYTYSNAGVYEVAMTVTDAVGAQATTTQTVEVTEDQSEPEPLNCMMSVSMPIDGCYNVNEPIQFYGDASGGVTPYSWHWNFGDDGTSDEEDPTHIYTNAGTYEVTTTVTDANGAQATDSFTIEVTDDEEDDGDSFSVTLIANPTRCPIGQPVTFTATASYGNPNYTYNFDFGDDTNHSYSTSDDSYSIEHTYYERIDYVVNVEVRDANGNTATDTIIVEIIDAFPPRE